MTTTVHPATDLGYLLHKHPDRVQTFDLPVGTAQVFYPEANESRCTAALLLDVDPVGLVRGRGRRRAGLLSDYVNDRPYAASSLLAVALGRVFRTALRGDCAARPQLAAGVIPLVIRLPAVPARGGAEQVERLFAPLGWQVSAVPVPLDPTVPA
ncbi:MAG: 3' terminal RNA ribose 2'-O-methyltransferase Hen1, partial [Phycicoccus sp.]